MNVLFLKDKFSFLMIKVILFLLSDQQLLDTQSFCLVFLFKKGTSVAIIIVEALKRWKPQHDVIVKNIVSMLYRVYGSNIRWGLEGSNFDRLGSLLSSSLWSNITENDKAYHSSPYKQASTLI